MSNNQQDFYAATFRNADLQFKEDDNFCGTTAYYRLMSSKLLLTDGVKDFLGQDEDSLQIAMIWFAMALQKYPDTFATLYAVLEGDTVAYAVDDGNYNLYAIARTKNDTGQKASYRFFASEVENEQWVVMLPSEY